MDTEKKVALVTGSSSGFGAATAIEFARKGIRVTITGRKVDRLNEVSKKCQEAGLGPAEVLVMAGDVTDDAFIKSIVQTTVDKFGRLDAMVNNAGISTTLHGVMDGPMELYDLVMRTNLRAPIIFTKEAAPHLEKTKGCIINVSSLSSMKAFHVRMFYAISKAALDQLTKCSSTELAPKGIRVNSVNPGFADSNVYEHYGMDRAWYDKFLESCLEIQPLQQIGRPEDIAKAISFLASGDAPFITGTTLVLDGGYSNVVPVPNIDEK